MKKVLVLLLIVLPFIAKANVDENKINPGYAKSNFLLLVGGNKLSKAGKSSATFSGNINPFLFLSYNIYQTEYGSLAINGAANYFTSKQLLPSPIAGEIKSNSFIGEVGANYITNSDSLNFFLGVGYNLGSVDYKIKSNSSANIDTQSKSKFIKGYSYYGGIQYTIKNNIGIFFMIKRQELDDVKMNSSSVDQFKYSVSNVGYTFGFSYSF